MKEAGTASNFKSGQDLLDPDERAKAIARVQKAIRVAMLENAEDAAARVRRCPRCGSEAVVKKGVPRQAISAISAMIASERMARVPSWSSVALI